MLLRALVTFAALIGMLICDASRVAAQTPAGCRPGCGQAKAACIGKVRDELHTVLGTCATGSLPRRQCRKQAKNAAKTERGTCRTFTRDCHTCCAQGGSDCGVGCGDGVVTPALGEQCDPPGALCGAGPVCDGECHCPAAATTSTTATTLVTATTFATTTTVIVTTTTHPTSTTTSSTTTSSTTTTTQVPTTTTTASTTTTTTTVVTSTTTSSASTTTTISTTTTSSTTTTVPVGCHLPATGETVCSNSSGMVIPCAGTGQDGDLRKGGPLSYTDNGNGTVTDNNTGLVWEKLGMDGSIHDVGNIYTWDQAFFVHVAALNTAGFAGQNDWRLPNVKELQSIIDFATQDPSVASAFDTGCMAGCPPTGCSCTAGSAAGGGLGYWSSTSSVVFHDTAWTVEFITSLVTTVGKSTHTAVRAVRGGSSCLPATGQTTCYDSTGAMITCPGTGQDGEIRAGAPLAYTDNGDGTVTDDNTGLVWEKLSRDGSVHDQGNTYTWDQTFSGHVATLNSATFAGHADWRVPNVKELGSIVNYGINTLAVSSAFNNGCLTSCSVSTCSCTATNGFYWSSSSYAAPTNAWLVLFDDGSTTAVTKSAAEVVRAVRGGS